MTDRVPTACIDFYRRGLERQIQGRAIRYTDLLILIGVLVSTLFRLPGQIPIYFYVLAAICIGLMFYVGLDGALSLERCGGLQRPEPLS